MARFKIGEKVVALDTHPRGYFKKGDIVTVDGLTCCQKCGLPGIFIHGIDDVDYNKHNKCGARYRGRVHWAERRFAPLANIADAIEYRLKVSIPELTEIKETQLQ